MVREGQRGIRGSGTNNLTNKKFRQVREENNEAEDKKAAIRAHG